jgi:hypothetical protein
MQIIKERFTTKTQVAKNFAFVFAVAASITIVNPGFCDDSTSTHGAAAGLSKPSDSSTSSTDPSGSAGSTMTPAASTESTSPQPATSSGFKPWLGEEPGKPATPTKVNKPAETPPPPGMEAALKLFKAKKWALAQKSFEGFINIGKADVQTHQCLAYCYYYQRIYSKAMLQFEWVAKNAQHISEKVSAANTARVLRCYRAGICPSNCLKPNDPRWAKVPGGGDELWITFHYSNGYKRWSEHHVGQVITFVNGEPQNAGTCPTCGGTGTVKVLKDGAPPPTQD